MKCRISLLIVCVVLMIQINYGQQSIDVVKGQFVDSANFPVQFATIEMLRSSDTSQLQVTLSDSLGFFSFNQVPSRTFILKFSSLGYKTNMYPVEVNGFKDTVIIGPIEVKYDANTLNQLPVKAKKPFYVRHSGKTIVNVKESIITSGVLLQLKWD